MEKYARQAVSEGVKNAEDLRVGGDSEIYRVLNLHYNRNNHIEVWGPQVRNMNTHKLHFNFICSARALANVAIMRIEKVHAFREVLRAKSIGRSVGSARLSFRCFVVYAYIVRFTKIISSRASLWFTMIIIVLARSV